MCSVTCYSYEVEKRLRALAHLMSCQERRKGAVGHVWMKCLVVSLRFHHADAWVHSACPIKCKLRRGFVSVGHCGRGELRQSSEGGRARLSMTRRGAQGVTVCNNPRSIGSGNNELEEERRILYLF